MQTVTTQSQLRSQVSAWRKQGQRIAFVPTMGNLHAGHLQLVQAARRQAQRVVVSIFVNPLQFGAGEDFGRYPRTLESDSAQLEAAGVDLLYAPALDQVYPLPPAEQTRIQVPGLSDILCGKYRPGHFEGVATVVAKLFHQVQPDLAVFGEKDYQQLCVIRKMVRDLDMNVEILGLATVREADGLAMSSRNQYLTPAERALAPRLHTTLLDTRDKILAGAGDFGALCEEAVQSLENAGFRPDYVEIRAADSLALATPDTSVVVVLAAAWLGSARLIDNISVNLSV